jgi:hypothetical protein
MLVYEISKKSVAAFGSIENAIAAGAYAIWTDEKIRGAFSYGHGTQKDFKRYMKDNAPFCYFVKG